MKRLMIRNVLIMVNYQIEDLCVLYTVTPHPHYRTSKKNRLTNQAQLNAFHFWSESSAMDLRVQHQKQITKKQRSVSSPSSLLHSLI